LDRFHQMSSGVLVGDWFGFGLGLGHESKENPAGAA
jgi:hypothetical protein